MHLSLTLVALFSLLVQSVAALGFRPPRNAARLTNAGRLSRGLSPRKPSRLYEPSLTSHAARALPSGSSFAIDTTQTTQTGYIGVFTTDGTLLGYYSTSTSTFDSTPNKRDILKRTNPTHSFITPSSSDALFNIYITSSPTTNINAIAQCSAVVSPTSSNVISLGNAALTSAAGVRSTCSTYYPEYQSDIWSVDLDTGRLHLHFVNADLSTYPNYFTYNTGVYGGLRVTGNIELSETDTAYPSGDTVEEVYLYWGTLEDWDEYY